MDLNMSQPGEDAALQADWLAFLLTDEVVSELPTISSEQIAVYSEENMGQSMSSAAAAAVLSVKEDSPPASKACAATLFEAVAARATPLHSVAPPTVTRATSGAIVPLKLEPHKRTTTTSTSATIVTTGTGTTTMIANASTATTTTTTTSITPIPTAMAAQAVAKKKTRPTKSKTPKVRTKTSPSHERKSTVAASSAVSCTISALPLLSSGTSSETQQQSQQQQQQQQQRQSKRKGRSSKSQSARRTKVPRSSKSRSRHPGQARKPQHKQYLNLRHCLIGAIKVPTPEKVSFFLDARGLDLASTARVLQISDASMSRWFEGKHTEKSWDIANLVREWLLKHLSEAERNTFRTTLPLSRAGEEEEDVKVEPGVSESKLPSSAAIGMPINGGDDDNPNTGKDLSSATSAISGIALQKNSDPTHPGATETNSSHDALQHFVITGGDATNADADDAEIVIALDRLVRKPLESSDSKRQFAHLVRMWNHACACKENVCSTKLCVRLRPSVHHQHSLKADGEITNCPCMPQCKLCEFYQQLCRFCGPSDSGSLLLTVPRIGADSNFSMPTFIVDAPSPRPTSVARSRITNSSGAMDGTGAVSEVGQSMVTDVSSVTSGFGIIQQNQLSRAIALSTTPTAAAVADGDIIPLMQQPQRISQQPQRISQQPHTILQQSQSIVQQPHPGMLLQPQPAIGQQLQPAMMHSQPAMMHSQPAMMQSQRVMIQSQPAMLQPMPIIPMMLQTKPDFPPMMQQQPMGTNVPRAGLGNNDMSTPVMLLNSAAALAKQPEIQQFQPLGQVTQLHAGVQEHGQQQ